MWLLLSPAGFSIGSCNSGDFQFLWHIPNGATETLAEHSSNLQPSINMHAPVEAFICSCSGADVLPRKDKGSGNSKPCAVDRASENIGFHSGLEPGTYRSTSLVVTTISTSAKTVTLFDWSNKYKVYEMQTWTKIHKETHLSFSIVLIFDRYRGRLVR